MVRLTWRRGTSKQLSMEHRLQADAGERRYFTAPWRKARICARFFLRPELTRRERYAKIAAALANDPSVTNRLVGQAIAHLQGRAHERRLEN